MSCWFCDRARRGLGYVEHRHVPRPDDVPRSLTLPVAPLARNVEGISVEVRR